MATDGDADRFGIVDETGQFVELHDLMPLLFQYLKKSRGWPGLVVRTTSMHNTIDQLAQAYDTTVSEVPVGFRNVCQEMLKGDILIGGEESGGFGYLGHIPERDGILSCLLLLEMLGAEKRPLSEVVRSLRQKFGPFVYRRIDQHGDPQIIRSNLTELRATPPKEVAGHPVTGAQYSRWPEALFWPIGPGC